MGDYIWKVLGSDGFKFVIYTVGATLQKLLDFIVLEITDKWIVKCICVVVLFQAEPSAKQC